MAKINLVKKRFTGDARLERFELVARVVGLITVIGFLLEIFYVTGRIVFISSKIKSVGRENSSLENFLESSKEKLENYVWVQGVVEKMLGERNNEYKYNEYLKEINSWLTPGMGLLGASFVGNKEISLLLLAKDVDSYSEFEKEMTSMKTEDELMFVSIGQESLSRSDDGSYSIKMRLKIK